MPPVVARASPVFLLDVDNTLFDSDAFRIDLSAWLDRRLGHAERLRYWKHFDDLRQQLDYADYLGAIQRLRRDTRQEAALLELASYLLNYRYDQRLYPQALAVIAHLNTLATTVLLTDGDFVLQPHKIQRSGLWHAVGGRVMVCIHKETRLHDVQERYPADQYVIVDDKPHLLATVKRAMDDRWTTVFVDQGHHALESMDQLIEPMPDRRLNTIGDMIDAYPAGDQTTLDRD